MWPVDTIPRQEISRDRKFQRWVRPRALGHLPGSPEVAFPWLSDGPSWLWVEVWAAQQPSDPSVCVYPCLRDPLRHSGVVTSTGPFIFSTCVSSTIEGTQILFLPQRGSIEGHSDTPSAWPPVLWCHRPVPVRDLLGTGLYGRRWAVDKGAKLHLYL